MAIAGLEFRPRFGTAAPKDDPAGVVLRGEHEWLVTGGEAEIRALLDAVVGLGVQVSAQSAILKFGNVVGTFDLGALGVLRVQCGKWNEDTFDELLEDLTTWALALPFSAPRALQGQARGVLDARCPRLRGDAARARAVRSP